MKREIKFDIVLKHIKDNDIIHEVFTYAEIFDGAAKLKISYLNEDGYVVIANRRFSELQDKNGVDIFEGDILKVELFSKLFFISFGKSEKWGACFCVESISSIIYLNKIWANTSEVIGNIYDNPELLK